MTARGWWLFALMSVLWGITYLFIKESVETFSPLAVAAGRTLIGAVALLPLALYRRALRPALRHWPWVLLFGAIEMGGPFLLLSDAERTLPSGLTGLLVSTVPLFAALIGVVSKNQRGLSPWGVVGLLLGFGGVAVIVAGEGMAVGDPTATLVAVGQVLVVAVMYAIVPFIIASRLADVPSLGSVTIALGAVGLAYLPFAILFPGTAPTLTSTASLIALGVLCTAVAFIAFFALIAEVGPVRAPLFTYVNPVVAVALGVLLAGEALTPGLLVGFPLVLAGCWLAATGGRVRRRRSDTDTDTDTDNATDPDPDPGTGTGTGTDPDADTAATERVG